ncbi:CRISPR-associated protein Cas2 [Caldicellulosiruptor acetigenus I77R1B]|uniref:CRISPR-associated endoribonuclease Cas2 n=1 Tax=Caldicellulosiruptor acetigenus (strain ATCC 700853 / DSM 12137 / I77R1B) TaxID=632335 RepID=E4S7V2_CALA7|nr:MULTISPECIES: CRISPR-associated endonuclease Cas2 [Caldicellulosiruptor]ADQ41852.1 CRISPR-associated protein Cas2 [Caldicellulosiruptor acetigenus I77R1B]
MFVIVTYDINEKRVNKVRKILKKYFTWVQNSVFEGEITLGKLEKCKRELLSVIEKDEDSVYFYEMEYKLVCNKKVLGQEKNYDSIII